ncbi:MAG: hypothetical protein OEL91_09850 [Burkholderiaceae bacterium]|nr:hypothetical protein [Burkholderiaceae bacterium]
MKPPWPHRKFTASVFGAGSDLLELAGVQFGVTRLGVADARDGMPSLIKQAAGGAVFIIQNAKNSVAPEVMLVAPDLLQRAMTAPRKRRTLAELIDTLPLRHVAGAAPSANLPDDVTPTLVVPRSSRAVAS